VTGGWILATRSDEELAPLSAALAAQGLRVVAYPVLREEAFPDQSGDLGRAAAECSWVAFTSRRAPAALRRLAGELWPGLLRLPVAAVGAATAAAAAREGFGVELVGDRGGEALAALLAGKVAAGGTVLHPCGREHRDELARALAQRGIGVRAIVVYGLGETAPGDLPRLPAEAPRAVLLTSPRAARAYLRASSGRYAKVVHLALGATTAAEAEAAGLAVRPIARPTNEAVVEELCRTCS
jgi:uroporphyrinogen-III synthase